MISMLGTMSLERRYPSYYVTQFIPPPILMSQTYDIFFAQL